MRRSRAPHRSAALIAVVMLLLVLASCGGGDDGGAEGAASDATTTSAATPADGEDDDDESSSSAAAATDVCALLTDEEIEQAVGIGVRNKAKGGGQGFATGSCSWELDAPTSHQGLGDFTVSVKTPGGRKQFDILASQMPKVPDLGDAAYQQGDSIWAVEDDHLVVLSFGFLNAEVDDPVKAVQPLIEIVLSKL